MPLQCARKKWLADKAQLIKDYLSTGAFHLVHRDA